MMMMIDYNLTLPFHLLSRSPFTLQAQPTAGIANRVATGALVPWKEFWGTRDNYRIFTWSFKCLILKLSDSLSHSRDMNQPQSQSLRA